MHKDENKPYLDQPRDPMAMRQLVAGILEEWGCGSYFVSIGKENIVGADKYDGFATLYPNKHVLGLSEGMLYWSTPAVVALTLHEVGHLVLGHQLSEHEDCVLNWVDEYEADEFAFDALKTHYGYTPISAGLWMLRSYGTWRWAWDSHTHPSAFHRWERLAWNGFVPSNFYHCIQELNLEKVEKYI